MIFHLATRVPEHLEVALDPGLIVHVGVSLANSKADKRAVFITITGKTLVNSDYSCSVTTSEAQLL